MAGSLRSFARSDRDAVLELSRSALARPGLHVGNPGWSDRDELDTELADWDPQPEETLFVAEEDGAVVGFGGVELPRGFPHAELFGPLVAERMRGHRLGAGLLDASVERARSGGADAVLGAIGIHNARTKLLLERNGFHPRGRPQATYRLTPSVHRPAETPAGVTVRMAEEEDLPAALSLYAECFPDGRFPEAVWRTNIATKTVYAAESGGRIVGVLNIDPSDRWIYHVGVTGSDRTRGVGAALLSRALESYWSQHPDHALGLDVVTDNVPAIRLYRRQGFAPWLVLQTYELAL